MLSKTNTPVKKKPQTDWMRHIEELREEAKTDLVTRKYLAGIESELRPLLPPDDVKGESLAIALFEKVLPLDEEDQWSMITRLWEALEIFGRDEEASKALTDYAFYLGRQIDNGLITDAEYARYQLTNRMGH
jgi:hypothetical protein